MPTAPKRRTRNRILSWIINLAGVLAFALVLYLGGVEAWKQIISADWRYVLAALAVTLLWNLVAAYRWSLIADELTREPDTCPFRIYFALHMIGMLSAEVVPVSVGMLGGRPVALSLSRGAPLRRAALSAFLDKLFDLILAVLLVVPVVLFLIDWLSLTVTLGLMGLVVAAGTSVLGWQYERVVRLAGQMASRFAQPLTHLPFIGPRMIRRLVGQLERLSTHTLLTNRSAVRAFLLTTVMYSLLSARLFLVAQALHLEIPWYLLAMGICVAQLTVVFSLTPGSLGFLEAG